MNVLSQSAEKQLGNMCGTLFNLYFTRLSLKIRSLLCWTSDQFIQHQVTELTGGIETSLLLLFLDVSKLQNPSRKQSVSRSLKHLFNSSNKFVKTLKRFVTHLLCSK